MTKTSDFPPTNYFYGNGAEVVGVIEDYTTYQVRSGSVSRIQTGYFPNSFSLGAMTQILGPYVSCIGFFAFAEYSSTAIGSGQYTAGPLNVSIGYVNHCIDVVGGITVGSFCTVNTNGGIAIGSTSTADYASNDSDGNGSPVAIGLGTTAKSITATAIGSDVFITKNSTAIGNNIATHDNGTLIGNGCTIIGKDIALSYKYATAIGYKAGAAYDSVTIGSYSGYNSNTDGQTNHIVAIGYKAKADHFSSISIGYYAQSTDYCGIAIGQNAIASGLYNIAIGYNSDGAFGTPGNINIGGDSGSLGGYATSIANFAYGNGGTYSIVFGKNDNVNLVSGEFIVGFSFNPFLTPRDHHIKLVANTVTIGGSNILTSDSNSPAITNYITLPENSIATMTGHIIGITSDFATNTSYDTASYVLEPWTVYNYNGSYNELNSATVTLENNTSGALSWPAPTVSIVGNVIQVMANNPNTVDISWMAILKMEASK